MHVRALPALLLLVIPVAAQAPIDIGTDAADDVKLVLSTGQSQTVPAPVGSYLDILGLTVLEQKTDFQFTLKVKDLKTGTEGSGRDGVFLETTFQHDSREFLLSVFHSLPGAFEFSGFGLSYRDEANAPWSELWFRAGGVAMDTAAGTMTVVVPRADLADARGSAPYPGRSLTNFTVTAQNVANFQFNIAGAATKPGGFLDRLPDTGFATGVVPISFGVSQTGNARLSSDDPFRASNGEATTFLYEATAQNIGDAADQYTLRATAVPEGWNVVLPEPTLELGGKDTVSFPVIVTVPFTHQHGAAASFVLELMSVSDPGSIGRLEMGVRYLSIPQPAGHHDILYLHSRPFDRLANVFGAVFTGNDGYAYMNTLAEHEGDAKIALSPQTSNFDDGPGDLPYAAYSWCALLDPTLEMGLDFIPDENGRIKVTVQSTAPLPGAILRAELFLSATSNRFGCFRGQDRILTIATLNGTEPQDIGANSAGILEGELDIWDSADRIPYAKGPNLMLRIEVSAATVPQFFLAHGSPRLVPGSELVLPMLDYADDVTAVVNTQDGAAIVALGPQQRMANPGSVIVFPLSLANDDAERLQVRLNLTGINAEWAKVPARVTVEEHSTRRIEVVVHVPEDALDGDVADIVLHAANDADRGSLGVARLLVNVQTATTVPDDAPAGAANNPSPGVGPAAAVPLLALAALALRRRGFGPRSA